MYLLGQGCDCEGKRTSTVHKLDQTKNESKSNVM